MNEKKIKVFAQVGDDLLFDVYVTVPQDVWDEEVDGLEDAVRDDIEIMVAISVQLMAVVMVILLHTDV